jgi:leucyl-tRNA synthetase
MQKYDHKKIEPKWQKYWERKRIFEVKEDPKKKKFYVLDMFPYPSAEGLHVGHPEGYTATDIIARKKRMEGFNVLHPMGFDAFGLPAENYAIKTGVHPAISTAKNIKRIRKQIKSLGFSYDWLREINTTDPNYYRWTQWIFLKLFKRGLAYEAIMPINWCPSCKTGLANEEVVEGRCERCKSKVTKKDMRQWMLKITAYADRLLEDLEELDWPKQIKEMQKNWIGRSEGAEVTFQIIAKSGATKQSRGNEIATSPSAPRNDIIKVFTTRPDTLFGATYLVVAPEHEIIKNYKLQITNYKEVEEYIKAAKEKSDLERTELIKEKTGVELKGIKAVNPVNGAEIPIWVADYVLPHYGTGAIMAVPAHDQRDYDFAKKYGLPIVQVIQAIEQNIKLDKAYEGEGVLINSGEFSGMTSETARWEITEWLAKKGLAKKAVNYKLRDWVFSRQRYWGEPIPLVFCENCKKTVENLKHSKSEIQNLSQGEILNPGWVPVPENELPVKLPKVKKYQPTGTGESPLAAISEWVNTKCPRCGSPAKRETNTMPQWAGSCWYYLRYLDPKNKKEIFDRKKEKYWMPVDLYVGGAEHAVLHLLYARFWHKVLYDEGLVSTVEPFLKLRNQGIILGEDGQKMSKSRGNVINPDDVINTYGADTMRLYEMFMGPFEDVKPWSTKGIIGVRRFLERVWGLEKLKIENEKLKITIKNSKLERLLHQTIKKVTEDIENFKFNTAISQMMILVNEMSTKPFTVKQLEAFLKILSPFAPHISEEFWQKLGHKKSIIFEEWPKYDPRLIVEEEINLVVQVNGKVRDTIKVKTDISEEEAKKVALESEKVKKWIEGKEIKKVIFVKGKLINIVINKTKDHE